MVVCDSSEQAKEMFGYFQELYGEQKDYSGAFSRMEYGNRVIPLEISFRNFGNDERHKRKPSR